MPSEDPVNPVALSTIAFHLREAQQREQHEQHLEQQVAQLRVAPSPHVQEALDLLAETHDRDVTPVDLARAHRIFEGQLRRMAETGDSRAQEAFAAAHDALRTPAYATFQIESNPDPVAPAFEVTSQETNIVLEVVRLLGSRAEAQARAASELSQAATQKTTLAVAKTAANATAVAAVATAVAAVATVGLYVTSLRNTSPTINVPTPVVTVIAPPAPPPPALPAPEASHGLPSAAPATPFAAPAPEASHGPPGAAPVASSAPPKASRLPGPGAP